MEPLISSYSGKPNVLQKTLLVLSIIILLVLSATLMLVDWLDRQSDVILSRPLNILLLGVDKENIKENGELERPRTDTMLFFSYNPELKKIGIFSIPRDSLVDIPGHGRERINMAHVYGGYELTREMVEKILGTKVQRYVMVNFEGFKKLVDLVGGVEVTVDKRMYYVDNTAGFKIDLQPGKQNLMGEDALGFVRYRRDILGDITRTGRQQKFLKALLNKLRRPAIVFKSLSLLRLGFKYLKTDLKPAELFALCRLAMRMDDYELFTATLPGEFSGPYWKLHTNEINRLLENFKR